MDAVIAGCVVVLVVLGLGFYAVRSMRPGRVRVQTSVLRLFSFSMEVESSDAGGKPSGGGRLGPGAAGTGDEASELAVPDGLSGE